MTKHFERAMVLFEQSRLDLAEKELRQGLLDDPEHPFGHAMLALCLAAREQFEDATREAQAAIAHAPDMPFAHYALARVYNSRDRLKEAKNAISEAINLDPENAEFFALLAGIELQTRNWQAALEAAEQGLGVDPEHVGCANLRAMALTQLGRKAEARELIDQALSKAPEDALSHANKGWTLLHQNKPADAMEHFRESLRLEPELDWAREGMIASLKARYVVYRLLLAYFLWMSRLSHKAQWGVILAIYFLPKVLRAVANANPALKPFILPVVLVIALFVLLTWIADPLFNMLLRLSRYGRLVLSRQETMASNALLACLALAVACFITGVATGQFIFHAIGGMVILMTVPVSGTLRMASGWPKLVLLLYTAGLAACATIGTALLFMPRPESQSASASPAFMWLGVWLFGIFLFSWIANGLAMVSVKR